VAQLRAFLALSRHLHFREAAAALRMSQPALSGSVAALEEALGTRLVERTTRRVLLTPAGERVAKRAEAVLAELERLVDEVSAVRGPLAGPLRLGVIPTVGPYLLPAVLPRLTREFPQAELSVREQQTEQLIADLVAGHIDAAVLALPAPASGVREVPLYEEEFLLAAPAALGGLPSPVPREILGKLDVILLNEGHCLRDQALDVCREVGARATAATYAASLATLVQLVNGGLGATLLPQTAVPVESRRGDRLTVRPFAAPAPFRRIGLVFRETSPRAEDFHELARCIREAVAEAHPEVRVDDRPTTPARS